MKRILLGALVGAALVPSPGDAGTCPPGPEIAVGGLGVPEDDLVRVGELAGVVPLSPRLLRRGGPRVERTCDLAPPPPLERLGRSAVTHDPSRPLEITPVAPRLASVWNMRYPSGANDGLLWAGRGLSQEASGGIAIRYGMLSAAVVPELSWSENRAFEIVPNGRSGAPGFGSAFYVDQIDLPQRFGAGPFATWSPGQSYVQLERWNLALGFSTENRWIGSGMRNSILLTNAGPGFPHLFVGTARPVDVRIGTVEALLFWGRLDRTRYMQGGGHPLIETLAVTYSPRWTPGLSIGIARAFLQPWNGLRFRDYFAVFQSFRKASLESWYGPSGDNPLDNQLASVFGRWVFPESGLEIYGEWAREDHDWTWWGFVREPDHSQAFLLGLQKVFRAGPRLIRGYAELTHLQEVRPQNERGAPVYYVHANDLGFTNQGQLLGAWIGPGGDSQTLGVDVLHRGGRLGGYVERVRRNDGYYWTAIAPTASSWPHDAEVAAGVRQVLDVSRFEVSWDASVAFRQNRDFLHDEPNVRIALEVALPLR